MTRDPLTLKTKRAVKAEAKEPAAKWIDEGKREKGRGVDVLDDVGAGK